MEHRDRNRDDNEGRPVVVPDATAEGASPSSCGVTSEPGTLARLAETNADIPRVHLRDTDPVTDPGPVVRPSSSEMPGPRP